jgi:hypothetical protein
MPAAKRIERSLTSVGVVLAVLCAPGLARAQHADATHSCVEAAHEGQRLRDAGQLIAGRAELLQCAAASCPDVVRDSCARWLGEVDARLPTLVLAARDEGGIDLRDVRVSIDARVVTTVLDGRALPVDPGPHRITFEAHGRVATQQHIVAREGDKLRPITAVLARLGPADRAETAPAGPSPVPIVVAGTVAALALGSFAVLGAIGQSQRQDLLDTCAPTQTCASSDVDAARTKLVVADVSLVVGLAATVVTGVLLARALGSNAPKASLPVSLSARGFVF